MVNTNPIENKFLFASNPTLWHESWNCINWHWIIFTDTQEGTCPNTLWMRFPVSPFQLDTWHRKKRLWAFDLKATAASLRRGDLDNCAPPAVGHNLGRFTKGDRGPWQKSGGRAASKPGAAFCPAFDAGRGSRWRLFNWKPVFSGPHLNQSSYCSGSQKKLESFLLW